MKVLECLELRKEFVRRNWLGTRKEAYVAVDALSFSIEQGEAVAFLGANGAGKSTTIKLLCGILRPTSGSCQLLDSQPGSRVAARRLGLVFGTRSTLAMHMTVAQCLVLNGVMYGLSEAKANEQMAHYSERFGIAHLRGRRVRTLSLGERMRVEIVAAILHEPTVLLLDEPTIGLDVVARNELRTLLGAWREEAQATLLLTSHDLHDVERLCSRALIIDSGRLIYDGSLECLKTDGDQEITLEEAMMRIFKGERANRRQAAATASNGEKRPTAKNGKPVDYEALVQARRELWGSI